MQGYDKNAALESFMQKIDRSQLDGMSEARLRSLLSCAIDLDFAYMESAGVLQGGLMGDSYYDDDDAYEYIVDNLLRQCGGGEDDEILLAQVVDAYMDCQQTYLESQNMLEWD